MKILVTGHRGYIGAVMVPMLIKAGHDVAGLDSGLFDRCSYQGNGLAGIPELKKDVRDVTSSDLGGIDAVIHLANLSNDPLGNLNPDLTFEINHLATTRLAEIAKSAGVGRFLFSSSCSLYGAAGSEAVTERADFNPVTPYGEAKVLAENDLRALADDDFSPTYMRNATAYGISPRLRFDLVLNNLVAWAVTTGRVRLKSDGTAWRPIVHIEDISRAFVAALEAPREVVHNEAFNVGRQEENYRIRDIAELVERIVPGCTLEYAPDASSDRRSYRVDFSKIAEILPGFRPTWTAELGVKECYNSFSERELSPSEFEGSRFRRIDHIKGLLKTGELGADLRWSVGQTQAELQ